MIYTMRPGNVMNLCASLLMIAMRPSKSRRSTWTASGKLYFSSQVSLWNRSASSHQKVTHLAKQQKFYDSIEFLRKFWQFYFGYSSSYNFVFFRWKIKVYCCSRWNPFFNVLCMFVTAPLFDENTRNSRYEPSKKSFTWSCATDNFFVGCRM